MTDRAIINGRGHSNLCLIAIYVIHVVLFHVFLPPKVSTTRLTPEFTRISQERKSRTMKDKVQNSSLFVVNAARVKEKSAGNSLRKMNDRVVHGIRGTLVQFPCQVPVRGWSKSRFYTCKNVPSSWSLTTSFCMHSYETLISAGKMVIRTEDSPLNKISDDSKSDRIIRISIRTSENKTANSVVLLPTNLSTLTIKNLSPAAWGIFLGCLVFLLTFTDRERELSFNGRQCSFDP